MNILFIYSVDEIYSFKRPLFASGQIQCGISYISAFLKENLHQTKLIVLSRILGRKNYNIIGTYLKRFYKLTTLDKLKKYYFRTYRFLWKVSTFRFNYKKLIPYLEMRSWYLRRRYAKYYKRLDNCNKVVEKKEGQ